MMPEDAEITEGNSVAESAEVMPEALAVAEESDGGRSIEVDEIEETNLVEETEDDLPCNSLSPSTSGVGCLSTSGVVCRSDCGSASGPSTRPSGSTLEWVV